MNGQEIVVDQLHNDLGDSIKHQSILMIAADAAIIELLIRKGICTREEYDDEYDKQVARFTKMMPTPQPTASSAEKRS